MNAHTVVLVLHEHGKKALHFNWRVRELFRGHWDAAPQTIAEAFGDTLGQPVQLHTVVSYGDVRYVVLRWSTAYSSTPHAPARAIPLGRESFHETDDETTSVRRRHPTFAHDSGTFLRTDAASKARNCARSA